MSINVPDYAQMYIQIFWGWEGLGRGVGRRECMTHTKILGNIGWLKKHLPYLINQFPPLISQSTLLCLGLSSQASGFLVAPLLDPSKNKI